MASYAEIAETIQARIGHGDYRLRRFPSGKRLAAELGVNPRTVERAMSHLLDSGILRRSKTGKYEISATQTAAGLHVALLVPAFPSFHTMLLHQVLDRLATARGWKLRLASYIHFRDPVVAATLRGFDATFFFPGATDDAADRGAGAELLPAWLVKQIEEAGRPIVMHGMDSSTLGIPCIYNASASGVRKLLDVLLPAGHRKVACVNAQPRGAIIRDRIDQWRLWTQLHGIAGKLFDAPTAPFGSAMHQARRSLGAAIGRGELEATTAIFCTTGATALGVMRALADHGLEPGRDIAVCATDDHAGEAPFLRPSLTCLQDPDIAPYLEVCLDWMARPGSEWIGPRCIHPAEMPLFVGESTALYRNKGT
ncbi:MAG: substrate-binding domain-containing protein [Lentisphaeria bacterium]|jgi:DNA-binding transcriptional regulator YhcF (GntR family)